MLTALSLTDVGFPVLRCFVTTKAGGFRDDACGEERAGGDGSFHVDAAYGYTLGIDDGSGLGGAGAEVRRGTGDIFLLCSIVRDTTVVEKLGL